MKTYKSNIPEITLKYKNGNTKKVKIQSSKDSAEFLRNFFNEDTIELTESFVCVFLNRANNSIGWFKVSQGGLSGTIVDIRLILATALKCAASSIILAHNHPSGNTQPSNEDIKITNKVKAAGEYMDIKVLDHIILTDESYYSFADENLI